MWRNTFIAVRWALVAASIVTGGVSALLWYRSAQVSHDPFMGRVEPADAAFAHELRLGALMRDSMDVSRLNRKAALLTAWSIGLSALASIVGAFV
ncbi:hypothetical protein ISP17_03450 [Dyella ginsengisoli]|uniref:Uncharacterized protein n=1 Tax=Dyella ginsengisoli TaxID=363848 RepID=A0ABW8JTF5_9GAMM